MVEVLEVILVAETEEEKIVQLEVISILRLLLFITFNLAVEGEVMMNKIR